MFCIECIYVYSWNLDKWLFSEACCMNFERWLMEVWWNSVEITTHRHRLAYPFNSIFFCISWTHFRELFSPCRTLGKGSAEKEEHFWKVQLKAVILIISPFSNLYKNLSIQESLACTKFEDYFSLSSAKDSTEFVSSCQHRMQDWPCVQDLGSFLADKLLLLGELQK